MYICNSVRELFELVFSDMNTVVVVKSQVATFCIPVSSRN